MILDPRIDPVVLKLEAEIHAKEAVIRSLKRELEYASVNPSYLASASPPQELAVEKLQPTLALAVYGEVKPEGFGGYHVIARERITKAGMAVGYYVSPGMLFASDDHLKRALIHMLEKASLSLLDLRS